AVEGPWTAHLFEPPEPVAEAGGGRARGERDQEDTDNEGSEESSDHRLSTTFAASGLNASKSQSRVRPELWIWARGTVRLRGGGLDGQVRSASCAVSSSTAHDCPARVTRRRFLVVYSTRHGAAWST